MVGATKRESMPVYGVMKYLQNQVHVLLLRGASRANASRECFSLQRGGLVQGYRCIPVNPTAAAKGEEIHGEKVSGSISHAFTELKNENQHMRTDIRVAAQVYARVSDIPVEVQLVDIFLRSDRVAPVARPARPRRALNPCPADAATDQVFEDAASLKHRPVIWTQLVRPVLIGHAVSLTPY